MPEHLHALHAQCFDTPWSEQSFAELLAQETTILIKPSDICFGLFRLIAGELEVLTLAVHSSARMQGLAKAIMTEAEGLGGKRIFLEVAHTNKAALSLYQSLGYTHIGLRKAYYANGADAITMQKTLD